MSPLEGACPIPPEHRRNGRTVAVDLSTAPTKDFVLLHSAQPSSPPNRTGSAGFFPRSGESVDTGRISFRLSSAYVGYPLARHLLLRVGSGNIDQSEDFIAMMHD